MNVDFWGPGAWKFIHSISFAYPEVPDEVDKQNMYQFLISLAYVLPCDRCRKHYKNWLKSNSPINAVSSRNTLSHWFVDLHNQINMRKHKPFFPFEKVKATYDNNVCHTNQTRNCVLFFFKYLFLSLGVAVLIVLLIKFAKM